MKDSFGENVGEIEEESQVDEIESKTISEKDDQPYLNVADKSSAAVNTYRKIGYFIRIFPVNSVLLFFRFFAGHLCCDVTHIDDSSALESREVKQVNKFDQNGDVFMDEKVEKGMLAFSFKYQIQSFGENIEEIEEELQVDEIESKTISEKEDQPYLNFADIPGRFLSEKILSGFTKEHVAKDGSSLDEMLYVSCGDATIRRSEVDQEALMSEKIIYYLVNEFYGYYYSEFDGSMGDWDNNGYFVGIDVLEFIPEDFYGFDFKSDTQSSSDSASFIANFEEDELWEHEDPIEQLKAKLKKVRDVDLPTILEESESLRTIVHFRQFKIYVKFLHENPMNELQKFNKSYKERMWKFEIKNENLHNVVGVVSIEDKIRKNRLRQFGHVFRMPTDTINKMSDMIIVKSHTGGRGRPKLNLEVVVQNDMWVLNITDHDVFDRANSEPHKSHQYNQVADEFQQFKS